VEQALSDGEDFELLLAIESARVPALLAAWCEEFPALPLSEIGSLVEAGQGETLQGGWDHFGGH
jgi:thiamine monophosphate kinase